MHIYIYIYIYSSHSLSRQRARARKTKSLYVPIQRIDSLDTHTQIPVLTTFSGVQPIVVPQQSAFSKVGLNPHVYGILQQTQSFTIREQVKFAPEYCFGCPPCLTQGKSFYITAGNDPQGTNFSGMLFRADEVSEGT